MKVYVLEVKNALNAFEFESIYLKPQFALEYVNFWELKDSEYRITEHEV